MRKTILKKLKQSQLTGRGGGCFPVYLKWEMVKKAAEKSGASYVICNASEGEPGVAKDFYILNNYPERVIDGMKIAINFFIAKKGIIYLNPAYYQKLAPKLKKSIGKFNIEIFKKPHSAGYIGGEESALLNAIEEKRIGPRLRPPFPVEKGLFGMPTLVNNVETFYAVSLVFANRYKKEKFYHIDGDCLHEGFYELPENFTIEKILKTTNNYPDFPFFVQVGGGGAGEVLNSGQLKQIPHGAGSIIIYNLDKHEPFKLIKNWVNFFSQESCGKCAPCREGTYRLKEILKDKEPDWELFSDLLDNLSDTAFCGLGCAVPIPIKSFIKNVLPQMNGKNIKLKNFDKKYICQCFNN